jgi:O-antigen/teichoic acid export membrane protein
MLVSDSVYQRIPKIWLSIGIVFLLLAFIAGPDFEFFYAYLLLSAACIARSLQIYYYRQKYKRRRRIAILTETQEIHHKKT